MLLGLQPLTSLPLAELQSGTTTKQSLRAALLQNMYIKDAPEAGAKRPRTTGAFNGPMGGGYAAPNRYGVLCLFQTVFRHPQQVLMLLTIISKKSFLAEVSMAQQ